MTQCQKIRLTVGGFNTNALSIFQESFLAKASDDAIASADRARMWVGACGWACSSACQENFVGIAFGHWWKHHERFRLDLGRAIAGFNAFTGIRSEESLFASASSFADTWAQWIGVFARAIATFALTVFFVDVAGGIRGEHHDVIDRVNLGRAFEDGNAFSTSVFTEMTFFASAAGDADTWADGVGFLARSIASFALTEFFVLTAHFLVLHGHDFGGRHAAIFRLNADAVFVFQEPGFAEATDDAIAGAFGARVRVGARGRAGGSTTEEDFVFFALRNLWWKSEELHVFSGTAFGGWHADATTISQMTFVAEASDDAVLGANWAWMGIGAGGRAGGAAGIEKFVVRAFWFGLRELHGDFVVRLAFLRAYTFTFGVLQETFLTETTDHTLEGTHCRWFGMSTIRYAGGSTSQKDGVGTAFFIDGKSRGGDSEPEGAGAEQ
jgi:hypothetical protein